MALSAEERSRIGQVAAAIRWNPNATSNFYEDPVLTDGTKFPTYRRKTDTRWMRRCFKKLPIKRDRPIYDWAAKHPGIGPLTSKILDAKYELPYVGPSVLTDYERYIANRVLMTKWYPAPQQFLLRTSAEYGTLCALKRDKFQEYVHIIYLDKYGVRTTIGPSMHVRVITNLAVDLTDPITFMDIMSPGQTLVFNYPIQELTDSAMPKWQPK